ncbi:MAG: 50S ribosomal protein L11 methyltransferase [Deltaproteobacteria bacterium]|nr:50S ribosomal protein L11 methyltransferase [Deltaproteobacteria bacterium]
MSSGHHKKNIKKNAKELPEPSPWRRCIVDVVDQAADAMTALLMEEDACGLETEDDETRNVPDEPFKPTGRSKITATFSRRDGLELDVAKCISRVRESFADIGDLTLEWEDLFAEDWNAVFKEQWEPLQIGKRIWIVPSWREVELQNEEIEIRMDPGMAFGTGTHETTQLCATAIENLFDLDNSTSGGEEPRHLPAVRNMLDVGTGSGVLSLVALKLGANLARGTDIDPVCVRVAVENAVENSVADRFLASVEHADTWGAVFDLVAANILAPTLIELAPRITGAVAQQGRLMLSGILVEQAEAVQKAYEAQGLVHQQTEALNGWVRIDLIRA